MTISVSLILSGLLFQEKTVANKDGELSDIDLFSWVIPAVRRIPETFFIIGTVLVSAVIITYFFCPRFFVWGFWNVPMANHLPEMGRGHAMLEQLQNPFQTPRTLSDGVIQWRLLFPLLGYYLRIPPVIYFALPHLGCLLILTWITRLTLQETNDRFMAFGAALFFGTTSWFFVSMGWLEMFDSWYILALLLASFHPSRWVLVLSCLCAPCIDERFTLALPLVFAVRLVFSAGEHLLPIRHARSKLRFVQPASLHGWCFVSPSFFSTWITAKPARI